MQVSKELQAPATLLVGKRTFTHTQKRNVSDPQKRAWSLRRDTSLVTRHAACQCLESKHDSSVVQALLQLLYRGADKSLARPTSQCILFDGENISFDASLVI